MPDSMQQAITLNQQANAEPVSEPQIPQTNPVAEAFQSGKNNIIPEGPAPSIFESDPSPVEIPEHLLQPQTEEPAEQQDLQSQLKQVADDYGLDPSQLAGFTDAQSAEAAANLFLDQQIQQGLSTLSLYSGDQGVQPSAPSQQEITENSILDQLELDEENLDAKTIKTIRALATEVQNSRKLAEQVQQQFTQVQQQQREATKQQLQLEANNIIDSMGDPRFGNSVSRNGLQQIAVQQLYQIADALAVADDNAGRQVRPLKTRLQIAARKVPGAPARQAKQTQQPQQLQQQPQPGTTQLAMNPPQISAPSAPRPMTETSVPEAQPPVQLGTLHKDQTLLRQVAQILSRRN